MKFPQHPERTELTGVTFPLAYLMHAYNLAYRRVIDSIQDKQAYFLHVMLPKTSEAELKKTVSSLIEQTLQVELAPYNKRTGVTLLRRKQGFALLEPSQSITKEYSFQGYSFKAQRQPISGLVDYLNNNLSTPVVDETELRGEYDISLYWTEGTRKALEQELSRFGLELINAEREITLYIYRSKKQRSP